MGRKQSESVPGVFTNTFGYNGADDLLTLTDGKGQVITWNYDLYGRVTNKLDATSREILRYDYDPNSRMTNRWSAEKLNTHFGYDSVGNLTSITYPVNPSITLQYDALNRLTSMVDGLGTNTYAYTSAGLLQSEDGPWANDVVSYLYYTNHSRTNLTLQMPNTAPWTQGYSYDAARRLTGVSSPAGSFGYAYPSGKQGLVGAVQFPNGAFITNVYNPVARPLSTTLKNSSLSVLNSHQYSYDLTGQRAWATNTAGDYRFYGYDNAGQLTSALAQEPAGSARLHEQLRYAYDPAGNLDHRTNNDFHQIIKYDKNNALTNVNRGSTITVAGTTSSGASNVTVNITNSANRYADNTFAASGISLVNGTNSFTAVAADAYGRYDTNASLYYLPSVINCSYDANGNLLTDGQRSFAYDDENQLTSVWVTNAWRSDFVYDGKMRRRKTLEYLWQAGTWTLQTETRFVYDGNLVIQERDQNNTPLVSYTRGCDLSGGLQGAGGIGGLLARTDNRLFGLGDSSAQAYYVADAGGNVTCLISTNQAIVAKYVYEPFGNIISLSGPLADANVYRFSSKENHQNSGMLYYGRRFYEPNLQRWINRDPLGESGGSDLYSYVGNSPINRIDPTGLISSLNSLAGASAADIAFLFGQGAVVGGTVNALAEFAAQTGRSFGGGKLCYDSDRMANAINHGMLTGTLFVPVVSWIADVAVPAYIAWRYAPTAAEVLATESITAAEGGTRTFFSVQSEADAARLASGGAPWPTGVQRANLGEGLYAWGTRAEAEAYAAGKANVQIIQFEMSEANYSALNTLDMRYLSDEAATAWLNTYSQYGQGLPHGFDHVIRATGSGVEYYFSPVAFQLFK